MKRIKDLVVVIVIVLALAVHARAAGVDDQYLDIYNQILQGESALQAGRSSEAAQQFLDAQSALQKLHQANPGWNPDLVTFRLQYLNDQLKALGKAAAVPANAPSAAATTMTPAPDLAELKHVIGTLQQQVRSLAAANSELQNKLHEALSVQPASVDPHELARAEDKIVQLQKERDLLSASLDEQKARQQGEARKPAPDGQSAKVKQLAKENEQLVKQRDQFANERDQLAKERDALKNELAARTSELSAAQSRHDQQRADSRKLEQTEKERDGLRSELAARTSELSAAQSRREQDQRADAQKLQQAEQQRDELQKRVAQLFQNQQRQPDSSASQNGAQLQKIEQLNARIAVLEAKPVHYTAEELAILSRNQSPPRAEVPAPAPAEVKKTVHSARDLPPGASVLMQQALRARDTGDFAQAEKKFNDVLRQDENNVYVLANLASTEFVAGRLDLCETNVQRALSLDPNDSGSLYLQGILRFRQGKLDDALNSLSLSAKINPTNWATQNYLGEVLSDKGLPVPAEAAFRRALELEPDYPDAHFNLGWVYATENPPFLALARWHYQKAVEHGHARDAKMDQLLNADAKDH